MRLTDPVQRAGQRKSYPRGTWGIVFIRGLKWCGLLGQMNVPSLVLECYTLLLILVNPYLLLSWGGGCTLQAHRVGHLSQPPPGLPLTHPGWASHSSSLRCLPRLSGTSNSVSSLFSMNYAKITHAKITRTHPPLLRWREMFCQWLKHCLKAEGQFAWNIKKIFVPVKILVQLKTHFLKFLQFPKYKGISFCYALKCHP